MPSLVCRGLSSVWQAQPPCPLLAAAVGICMGALGSRGTSLPCCCSPCTCLSQFASKVDKPLVEIFVADEWSRPEQAVVRYKMAVGFHRSSWDWIGLYRVGAWGLLWLEGVGSTAQHCGVPSELRPHPPPVNMVRAWSCALPYPGIMMWSCFRKLRSTSSLFLLLLCGPYRAPGHTWRGWGGVQSSFGSPCVSRRG